MIYVIPKNISINDYRSAYEYALIEMIMKLYTICLKNAIVILPRELWQRE